LKDLDLDRSNTPLDNK